MKTISIPTAVQELLRRLEANGYAAYAVGGCVRDSLLGLTPNDWDICTAATPEETAATFAHTVLTGAKYGTVTVLRQNIPYEVTTFRTEDGYRDHRHPERIDFVRELSDDLSRRDFTINAMAADASGLVHDPMGGTDDLKKGRIRCVGQAEARFSEDALRILRALRFAARFGFTVEAETAQAIHRLAPTLSHVAPERLKKELTGLLCGKNAAKLCGEFADVLCFLIPELSPCVGFRQYNPHHRYDVWTHTLHAVAAEKSGRAELRIALLLHDVGKPCVFSMDKNAVGHFCEHAVVSATMAEQILRRLRFDNAAIRRICTLISLHDRPLETLSDRSLRRLLYSHGAAAVRDLIDLHCADRLGTGTRSEEAVLQMREELLARIEPMQAQEPLQLGGRQLLAMGVPEGPEIGRILAAAREAVIDGNVKNDPLALMQFAQQWTERRKTD